MYHSFLYGNGLTLAIFHTIKQNNNHPLIKYFDINNLILDLISYKKNKAIKDFQRFFNKKTTKLTEIQNIIKADISKIQNLGFEAYMGEMLLNKEYKNNIQEISVYLHLIYNYWFQKINKLISENQHIKNIIRDIGYNISNQLPEDCKIFTTNFDTLLDHILQPEHIHGQFAQKLKSFNDIIAYSHNKNEFEYIHLFGTNGYEKQIRLNSINNHNISHYNLNFFHKNNLKLKSLLIYGLAFGQSKVLPQEFFNKYPQYTKDHHIFSVDGHIIERLLYLEKENNIDQITIAYYSKDDLENYHELFDNTKLKEIIIYKPCREVFTL